jgi:hypothetical protein
MLNRNGDIAYAWPDPVSKLGKAIGPFGWS